MITPLAHRFQTDGIRQSAAAAAERSSSGGSVVSRERLRDRERLAGCDNQVDSETFDERKESASERVRASQCSITATTRYRCVELEVVLNVGWSE